MSWLASIFITLLSGILGLFCAGFIGQLCVGWYRVSSFEGGAGHLVVFIALGGGLASLVVGLVATRLVAAGADPGFFKGLGVAWGAVLGLALVALGICRLRADLAPEMDGRELELAIEVRCPKGFAIPTVLDEYGAIAKVYLPGGRRLPSGKLQLDAAQLADGQWVVPATVPLTTRSSRKFLSVQFNKENSLIFGLSLRSNPQPSDQEWSKWVDAGWETGKPEPAPEAKFKARYRVQQIVPPPPAPDPAVVEAEKFAALKPAAPLAEWLAFMTNEAPMERHNAVAAIVATRQPELAQLIRSPDAHGRERALHVTAYLTQPTPEVAAAILAEGREIAAGIRRFNAMQDDDPKFHDVPLELRTRFNHWKQAWWVVHQSLGVDGRPPVKEIHDLALVRTHGTAMDEIEVNARVILDQLNKSATEKKT